MAPIEDYLKPLWQQFVNQLEQESLGQALLLLSEATESMHTFVDQMTAVLVCTCLNKITPCQCQSTSLLLAKQHPDVHYLVPDKAGGVIKVEQIRALDEPMYRQPRLSKKRVIIINPANKMNLAAANALLKILEEPPTFVFFLLLANQISTILPTVLSRCQRWQFPLNIKKDLGIAGMQASWFADFSALLQGKTYPLILAEQWSKEELGAIFTFLYQSTANLIKAQLGLCDNASVQSLKGNSGLSPMVLFSQLDKLKKLKRYVEQGIAINPLVSLEAVLLGYVQR